MRTRIMLEQKLRAILLSVILLFPTTHDCLSVRARRSIPSGDVSDQDVIHAINVLQRAGLAKTHLQSDDDRGYEDDGRGYENDLMNQLLDSSMKLGDEEVLSHGESDEDYDEELVLPGLPVHSPVGYQDYEEEEEEEEDERKEEEEKRVVDKQPVDKEELSALFKPTAEVFVESSGVSKELSSVMVQNGDKQEIVKSEIVKLLSDDGAESESPKVVEVDKVETEETKPDKDGILRKTQTTEWIFKPDVDQADLYPKPDGLPEGLANKEWLIDLAGGDRGVPVYSDGDSGRSVHIMKKKRASEPPIAPTTVALVPEEKESMGLKREAVEILKAYIEQQEAENRHLAKALNLATLSQVEGSDRYLEEEIDHIKKAAQNERVLETLREIIALASQTASSGGSGVNLEDLEPYMKQALILGAREEKRDSGQIDPESSTEPVLYEPTSEEDVRDEIVSDAIKNKLRELLIRAGEGEEREETRLVPAESIINEYNKYRLNPFLRDIYEVESVAPPGLLPYVDKLSESDDAVCEPVELLTDNCRVARSRNLLLDAEATDLCDRHKICYKCGGYFGMSPETCDKGYMNEAALACSAQGDSNTCHEDALGLYALMIRQHNPLSPTGYPAAPRECSSPCVYEYIVGMDSQKRR